MKQDAWMHYTMEKSGLLPIETMGWALVSAGIVVDLASGLNRGEGESNSRYS